MAISPRSTVSSDLYSPSEPEQAKAHLYGGSCQASDPGLPFETGNHAGEGSDYSDTMQGLDSAGEDTSRPASAAAGLTPGLVFETPHKRKRDEDGPSEGASKEHMALNHGKGQPLPPGTNDFTSMGEDPHQWHDSEAVNDSSWAKRSRPNDRFSALTSGTKSTCKLSMLPAALWQHIFCFVPPVFLGRLLRVNQTFNSYLSKNEHIQVAPSVTPSIVQPMTQEAIWVASRRRFAPGLPRPIHGLRELDMWKLLIGQNCQKCGHIKPAESAAYPENLWEAGPGETGVRIVWPFGIRCCGSCLQDVSKKELELYLSTCPSFLMPAIPFAFVSEDNHYIGHNLLRNQTASPTLKMTKHYYKPAIEDMIRRFEDAKALGAAPAEEWTKGLAGQGQEHLEDIIRWEQWESKGGLKKVNSRHHPKPIPSEAISTGKKAIHVKDEVDSDRSTPQSVVSSTRIDAYHNSAATSQSTDHVHLIPSRADKTLSQSAWSALTQHPGSMHQAVQAPVYHPRPERNIRDVNEAKAARRAEIERRCAALDPPLAPNVLIHMESFQAAIQITQPMTEQAWQILRPRLLTQFPYAERKEKERLQQDEFLAEESRQRQQQEIQLKESKETFDRDYENLQYPVRNSLGALADEFIDSTWARGRSVTKEISPKFAADVLLHVRERFYAVIAQEDQAAVAAGKPVKTDSPTRKLTLDHMKWLFDTKVKPLTDHFQRELFLCNGCDGNFKFYGFEGVIQHYAAKHTTTLSLGNIVVHWRAEWPEHPLFNPNPSAAKSAYYKVPTPSNAVHAAPVHDHSGSSFHGDFDRVFEVGPVTLPPGQDSSQYSVDTSLTTYGGSGQEGHRTALSAKSYPPHTTQGGVASYLGAPNGYVSSSKSYNPYAFTQQSPVSQVYGSSYPGKQPYAAYAQTHLATNPQPYFPAPNGHTYGNGPPLPYANFQNGALAAGAPGILGPVSDLYQRQMDEMAKHAKEVFIGIGGVKDLPGSVRIYVVIQLTVSRFKATFANEPSLTMFIDGLDHNAIMRPVRSVNGLGCKTCIQSGTGAKLFTLPHLVNHFKSVHVESSQSLGYSQAPEMDWRTDMIDLPDASVISKLVDAAGMTDSKLGLIASVFQGYFPSPLPSVRGKTNTGSLPVFRSELDISSRGLPGPPAKATNSLNQFDDPSNNQFYGQSYSNLRPLYENLSAEMLEPPGEDEYDPHRPAVLGKTIKADSGSRPNHEPAKSFTMRNSQSSSLSVQHGSSQQPMPTRIENEQYFNQPNALRSQFTETYPRRPYEAAERTIHPDSPRSGFDSRSEGLDALRNDEETVSQQHKHSAKNEIATEYCDEYHRIPEYNSIGVKPQPSKREAQSPSLRETVNVADQFLSSLVGKSDAGRSRGPRSPNYEIEQRPELSSRNGPQVNPYQKHFGEDGAYDLWSAEGAGISRQGNDSSVHQVRTGPSNVQNGVQKGTSQRPRSRVQLYEEYRSTPQAQMPLTPARTDQSPASRYHLQQDGVRDRKGVNGSVLVRPRSGSHTVQMTRASQFGPASVSPHGTATDMAPYRPRSPVEEDRGGVVYRARSPPLCRQKEGPELIAGYEVPQQGRYEYIDDRDLREVQYQPRFEYVRVPVDYDQSRLREPPARYVVSHPVEPQYIRYEQAYAGNRIEPIYERDGQYYHASHRPFQEQPSRAASSFPQSYKY